MLRQKFVIAALALAGSLFSAAALGADALIEEVMVTARKVEENLNSAPVTVSAFTDSAIESLDLNSVEDVARFAPGLSFSKAFGRATERPVVRGQGNILAGVQFGVESGVAYFVDGMYYSGDIQSLDMSNLDRVEVIKGPQSGLYGRNTYSGAINFITRGAPEQAGGRLRVRVLEDGDQEVVASFGGQLIQGVLGAQLTVRDYSFDGQWRNLVTDQFVGGEETSSANLRVDWNPSEALSLQIRAQTQSDDDGTRPFFLQPATENNCYPGFRSLAFWPLVASTNRNQYFCGEIKERPIQLNDGPDADGAANIIPGLNPGSTFFGNIYNLGQGVAFSGVARELDVYGLKAVYALSDGYQLSFLSSHRYEERKTGSDSDHGPTNFILAPGGEALFSISDFNEYEDHSYEVRLESFGDAFSWSLGGFYYDYENDESDLNFGPRDESGGDNFITNAALFGSLAFSPSEALSLTLEGRYANEKKTLEDRDDDGEFTFQGEENFKSFAPRLTLDYQLQDGTLIYGIYSQGIKPGGLNGATGVATRRPAYEEEESQNFELGIKRRFFNDRVQANAAFYFVDIEKYQLTTPVESVTGALNSVVTNQGNGEVFGIELDLTAALNAYLTAGATYALADSKFTEGCDEFQWSLTSGGGRFVGDPAASMNPTGGGDCSIVGNQFPMGSKHQASAYLDWSLPIGDGGMRVFGNLNLSYESKRYTQVHQEAYAGAATLVGARIGLAGEQWRASLMGRNLTQEDSVILPTRWLQSPLFTFASLNVAPGTADRSLPRAFFAAPRRQRQVGLELEFRF